MWLRPFSKLTCLATLFLIFVGGLVKSTESGLAVPDWPLSYGMLFPPMVGGVFYEHGHRMVAATVGFLTLILAVALQWQEKRVWLKKLGWGALGAVILQGVLGGITVLLFLPTPISVLHGILAQTFLVLTLIIAYSLSAERDRRGETSEHYDPLFIKLLFIFIGLIYAQLMAGAVMRHTESGLAIPDFPTMGGQWLPAFDQHMLNRINNWRFDMDLPSVNLLQVIYHFLHRAGALVIFFMTLLLNVVGLSAYKTNRTVIRSIFWLDALVVLQIILGIITVLTRKEPYLTSLHVMGGAAILATTVLILLRAAPRSWNQLKQVLS